MIDEIRPIKERPSPLLLLLFGLLGWLCATVEVGALHRLPLMGAALPLVWSAAVQVSWRRGAATGAVFSLVGGIALDALCGHTVYLTPLLLIAVCVYTHLAARCLFDHPVTRCLVALPPLALLALLEGIRSESARAGLGCLVGGVIVTLLLLLPLTVRRLRRGARM